jgi:hypothetical protein
MLKGTLRCFPLLLALAWPALADEAPGPDEPVKTTPSPASPEQELRTLGDYGMAYTTRALRGGAQFYPFAFIMRADGAIQRVAPSQSIEFPTNEKLVATLEQGFREAADEGRYRAVAILSDVVIALPDGSQTDAIQVALEHREGSCRSVFYPYSLSDEGALSFHKPISGARAGKVFACK